MPKRKFPAPAVGSTLRLPEAGVAVCRTKHNCNLTSICDWIELNATFGGNQRVTQGEILDILHEESIYTDRDFGMVFLEDCWTELRRRTDCLGESTCLTVEPRAVRRIRGWQTAAAYAFCLLLAARVHYRSWSKGVEAGFTEQGALFERITAESMRAAGWSVVSTGWSPYQTSRVRDVIEVFATGIAEPEVPNSADYYFSAFAKEDGLDLVCFKGFPDGRGGRPVLIMQCASGDNWTDKLHTPDPELWARVIHFTTRPRRAFAIPFALEENEFRLSAIRVDGLLLDRVRLVSPNRQANWISSGLLGDLSAWISPKIATLPWIP